MSALTFILKALGYDDLPPTSNPTKKGIDRTVSVSNVPVENDGTLPVPLDPFATSTVFDGSRVLGIDGSSAFNLTLSPVDATVYRATWTGVGAAPTFRTDRAIDAHAIVLTLTLNANLSVTVTAGSGTPFTAVLPGDVVFIPGVSTGDSPSPFNSLNEGYWTVLSATGTVLVLARDPSQVFSGAAEVVTPSTAIQIQAFTAAGVQVGDTVDISAGFAQAAQKASEITAVNPKWVQFRSTAPLGPQSNIVPGVAGLVIYTAAKRFVLIESDQNLVVRYNGDTGNTNRLEPLLAGDPTFVGSQHKFGTCFKLVLVNRASVRANVVVSSAE